MKLRQLLAPCSLLLAVTCSAQVTIPWTDVDKTGSSLADLATRSAGDLNSGTLDNARLDSDLTSWAAITRASGFDTFTATPSGANLAGLLTTPLPASKGGTGLNALAANVVSLLGAADYSAMRTQLGLVIGTNVQAYDTDLANLSALGLSSASYYAQVATDGTGQSVPRLYEFQPRLRLDRIKGALGNITATGSGSASVLVFGDSISRSLVPDEVIAQLYRIYGFRGLFVSWSSGSFGNAWSINQPGGTGSGAAIVQNQWTRSPNGLVAVLDGSGERVSAQVTSALPNAAPNKATFIYTKKSGGGIFKIQTLSGKASSGSDAYWQDVGSNIDTSNASTVLATQAVTFTREVGAQVRAIWVSGGECEIVGILLEDTTAAGLIVSYLDTGGSDLSNINTIAQADLSTILNVIHPDLITWAFKDGTTSAVITPKLTAMQSLWDAAYNTDWLFITPYPDSTAASAAQAVAQADPVIIHAITNGREYWNVLNYYPYYTYGTDRGWMADVTHLSSKGSGALTPALWRATGLLPRINAGNFTNAGAFPSVVTDTLTLDGFDQATRNRLNLSAALGRRGGMKIAASSGDYIYNIPFRSTAIDTGSATVVMFVRAPTGAAATTAIGGLRSSTSGGNQNSTAYLEATSNDLRVQTRSADNLTSYVYATGLGAGTHFWARAGEIVMLAFRRDAAAAAGVSPISVAVNTTIYPTYSTTGTGLEAFTGQVLKLGAVNANVGANDLEFYGAALYTSALSDAQLQALARTGDFPAGAAILWTCDEGQGLTGRDQSGNGYQATMSGATWTRNRAQPFVQITGNSYTAVSHDVILAKAANGTLNTYTLPASPKLGDVIEVSGWASGGWRIAQPASTQIFVGAGGTVGTNATTAGTSGYIQSGGRYDSIKLRCVTSDTVTPSYQWVVVRFTGTLTWN